MRLIAELVLRLAFSLALFASASVWANSEPSTSESPNLDSAIAKARAILQTEVVPKVPGMSVAVAQNGAVVWLDNFGYADLAKKIPVTSRTRFRIGSISKPLTSAALALLVERGLIDLDVPIQTYIPDFPIKGAAITVRLLAGHLSGIRDYRRPEALSNISYRDARSRLKIFEDDPLKSTPGEQFRYSSFNWDVIEVAIEQATHQDFVTFMRSNVLEPLSLNDTYAERPSEIDAQRTQFYETDKAGEFVLGPAVDNSYAWAAGGYLSTTSDLVRFGSALLQPGFLKESSLRLLFSSQLNKAGVATGYGVGWFVWPGVIYHSGQSVGGISLLLMLPKTKTVVAILTNRGDLDIPEGSRLHFDIEGIGYTVASLFSPTSEANSNNR